MLSYLLNLHNEIKGFVVKTKNENKINFIDFKSLSQIVEEMQRDAKIKEFDYRNNFDTLAVMIACLAEAAKLSSSISGGGYEQIGFQKNNFMKNLSVKK